MAVCPRETADGWSETKQARQRRFASTKSGGLGMSGRVTYPPLDVPKPVADGVWIVDSGPLNPTGVPLPIRMTVLRLSSGGLLLHSPTLFSQPLLADLERLGPVEHLLAPSFGHWQFVADWQRACPGATTWAVPKLGKRAQVRASRLRIDRELDGRELHPWGEELEHVVVPGAADYREAALFHRPSRTLVLTDLVVNLERERLPLLARIGVRLAGSLAPDGKAPIHVRLLVKMGGARARAAAERLLGFGPERVIFAHGTWFKRDAEARLRRSLRWLVD
jgi:hypothetical protein